LTDIPLSWDKNMRNSLEDAWKEFYKCEKGCKFKCPILKGNQTGISFLECFK
jgi:hypothetical protein